MTDNLLLNPGFEKDWGVEESHTVLICEPGKPPRTGEVGNIFAPPNWLPWYQHDDDYAQPEVRDAWLSGDARRVHSGKKAILLFTFYRRHKGGFLQQVSVQPGQRLRFTAWMHAWSNNKDPNDPEAFPHPDDGRWSEGAGYQEIAWVRGTQPHDTGDPQQDAKANFTLGVGIDPTGGRDPLAETVIWGEHYHVYNGYVQQLSVEAVAQADQVTVFTYSRTLWPFKHNDLYLDDGELVVVDDEPPVPPPYESTMLVLPQDASREQLAEIFAVAYPDRRTVGFSFDDAGVLGGTAVLYNVPEAEKWACLDFYDERYPSVAVQFAYTSDWEEPVPPPSELLLWQCDPRWKDEKLAGDCDLTLCQTGCWIACSAMAQRFFEIKPDATPSTANQALGVVGGFSGCLTLWEGMKTALGLEVFERHYDDQRARDWLDGGNVCFAEVEPEDYMHFVLVTRYSEGRFWMLDPYKGVEGWLDEYYPGAESWRSICPYESEPTPPPPPGGTLIGLHLQTMVPGALDYMAAASPRVAKVFQLEHAKTIKGLSPTTLVVLRYYTVDQNVSGDLADRAREYVATFEDSLRVNAPWIDYVESYNELIATHDIEGIQRSVEFDCQFADALMALGLPVAPILLNVAVGNPYHQSLALRGQMKHMGPPPVMGLTGDSMLLGAFTASEIELLLPAVEQVVKYGGAIGYHKYGLAVAPDGDLNDNWQYYAGRALEGWDPVFRAHGLYPDYISGEAGAFSTCADGWRADNCLDGDWGRYLGQLKEFQGRLRVWNAAHGYRCLGAVLFTSGQGVGWDSFQIAEAEMISMAAEL